MFDLLIKNGRIIDGSGNPWFRADVGIEGGKIKAIGRLAGAEATQVIDAKGQVVAPGFIDLHSHADYTLLVDPKAESAIRQGVTTLIIGNCGHSASPLTHPEDLKNVVLGYLANAGFDITWRQMGEYLDRLEQRRIAVNVGSLAGHNAIRVAVIGYEPRLATPEELEQMKRLLAEALDEGALGFSTGLEYTPGNFSDTHEVVELCKVAAGAERFYATHVRQRDYQAIEAAREAIQIATEAQIALQFSHLPPRIWAPRHANDVMIEMVEEASRQGLEATFDSIVYTWGATTLATILPPWAREGGPLKTLERLKDPETREEIKAYRFPLFKFVVAGQWDQVALYYSEKNPQYCGMTFAEIGRERGKDPHEAILDLILEEGPDFYGMMWSAHSQDEEEIETALKHPHCIPESDGLTLAHSGPLARMHHPFTYGWVARMLGYYIRERKLVPLEEAIRKMTSFPAQKAGLRDRGLLREGLWADLVIFDEAEVEDHTSLKNPDAYPSGFSHVLVNGHVVFDGQHHTGALEGVVIRR